MTRLPDPRAGSALRPGCIFTIPTGQPFLDVLARAVLAGDLPQPGHGPLAPLDLPDFTILLPTRRAARALQEAFARASGGRAMLLPAIRAVGDAEEDASFFADWIGADPAGAPEHDIPRAMGAIERRLALAKLVLRWAEVARAQTGRSGPLSTVPTGGVQSVGQAVRLAAELGRFLDLLATENVSLDRLNGLVPDQYAEHWQQTLRFLDIVRSWWPVHVAASGAISEAERRSRLLRAEARRLTSGKQTKPFIVASVSSTTPATAELLRAVAGLPHGAIVLPGLDQELDRDGWDAITSAGSRERHPEHPQFGLKRLLDVLGVAREAVVVLTGAEATETQRLRSRLVSEALRPAASTERWQDFMTAADRRALRTALDKVSILEAATAEDEAEVVALILREAAEQRGCTAALVTQDRVLARRVSTRLSAWSLRVDDSAGVPFGRTLPGAFLELVIAAQARAFAPVQLMALLKHPFTRLGLSMGQLQRSVRALEVAALRTVYLGSGLDGLGVALERARRDVSERARRERAVRRLHDDDWDAARLIIQRLKADFAPLSKVYSRAGRQPLASLLGAHLAAAENLAKPGEVWIGDAGDAASRLFAGMLAPDVAAPELNAADYLELYRALVGAEVVRMRTAAHSRLSIWGPLEAQLQQPHIVVLGALNEGTWPEAVEPGPWLSRPMLEAMGLPPPEERVGRAAHLFSQLLGAQRVYLTRAHKVDGVPTVPSRWLLRITGLLGGLGLADAVVPDRPWLSWASQRNAARRSSPPRPPEPRPAVALRPRKLSVTDVEKWIANPYEIFARKILKLEPLPPLGAPPNAALRGSAIHNALAAFIAKYPDRLPSDPGAELVRIAGELLRDLGANPRVTAFWIPRFERFATWFGLSELHRRTGVQKVLAEVAGARVLQGPAGPFTLSARADRVDVARGGNIITDYKTMGPSSLKRLKAEAARGESPQLALEAAVAFAGGFAGLPAGPVERLRYISAWGGEPPGVELDIQVADVHDLAQAAWSGFERLVALFDDARTPYRAVRREGFDYRYDDFALLARVSVWASVAEEED